MSSPRSHDTVRRIARELHPVERRRRRGSIAPSCSCRARGPRCSRRPRPGRPTSSASISKTPSRPPTRTRRATTSSQALNDVDWKDKIVTVRINGLDTHWCYRDVLALVEKGGERLDAIMIPKVGNGVGRLCHRHADDAGVATSSGRKKKIGLEVIIETVARPHQHRRDRRRIEAAGEPAFRLGRLRRVAGHAHDQYRRRQCGLCDADRRPKATRASGTGTICGTIRCSAWCRRRARTA